jgi:hypothetical protein
LSSSSTSSHQQVVNHIRSLVDTTTALQSSLLQLEKETKNLPLTTISNCPCCAVLREKLQDAQYELRNRKSFLEMEKEIKSLKKQVLRLSRENLRLLFNNNNKNNDKEEDKEESNNNSNNIITINNNNSIDNTNNK